jgi:hypothetical protein
VRLNVSTVITAEQRFLNLSSATPSTLYASAMTEVSLAAGASSMSVPYGRAYMFIASGSVVHTFSAMVEPSQTLALTKEDYLTMKTSSDGSDVKVAALAATVTSCQ